MLNIKHYLQKRFDRFYRLRRWHLILDASLLVIILILLIGLVKMTFFKPDFDFSVWVAPQQFQVDLNNPDVEVNLNLATEAIKLEDGLPVELHLKNKGQIAVSGLKLKLIVNNNDFSILKITTPSAYELDKNAIDVSGFEFMVGDLQPGAEINTGFVVYFKARTKVGKVINWSLASEYEVNNQLFKHAMPLADVKVAARINAQAAGYYNSPQGDQLGSGPLPPIVGFPTNFWVFFKVEPSGDFENFVMNAKLPKNVSFTDSTSLLAGTLNYNPSSRQIIWQIDSLTEGGSDYRAGFEVQLTPTKEQIGKEVNLLDNIKFQALDSFTGLKTEGVDSALNTGLEHDSINQGEGKVSAD
jgi:hypothetical protein